MEQETLYNILSGGYGEILETHAMWQCIAALGIKPFKDGNQWCFLYGDNIQEGICGFGETIFKAAWDFYTNIKTEVAGKEEQKSPEWSDEDEEHLDSIIESYKELLKDYSANHGVNYIPYNTPVVARTVLNDIKFLKSLRSRPKSSDNWKPSEEQMEALARATNRCVGVEDAKKLIKLLEQLKKL